MGGIREGGHVRSASCVGQQRANVNQVHFPPPPLPLPPLKQNKSRHKDIFVGPAMFPRCSLVVLRRFAGFLQDFSGCSDGSCGPGGI